MATVQEVYERHFPARVGGPSRPSPSSWEVWSWFFMRISGLLLLFLVLGHLAIMHVFGGGLQRVNFDFVAARWHGIFWRSYDWLLLALALLHGTNGARTILHDYVRKDGVRVALKAVLYTATFVFLSVGTLTIVTFNAAQFTGK